MNNPLKVDIDNSPEFFLDYGETINYWHKSQNLSPDYEHWETQVFIKMLSDRPRILDIGANIGWYSCIASAVSGGKAEIHAFEPEPANFDLLNRNVEINQFSNVITWNAALGAEDGETKLFLNEENPGDHRMGAVDGREAITVDLARLDTLLAKSHFLPDLVKIDVQGAEPLVFAGAERTFAAAGPSMAMFIEFQPESLGIQEAHDLADRLFAFNRPVYDLYPYEGGGLRVIERQVLHEAIEGCLHPRHDSHIDILIAPLDGRLEKIKDLVVGPFVQWTYS